MSQAEEVRAGADIVRIVGEHVKLRKAGANYMGLCPFHQEKSPSFAVHPVKQIFHCFGCGVGGDVFKFVMLIENLSFPEALRQVAEKSGIKLSEREVSAQMDSRARERLLLQKIHEAAARFYAEQLGGTAEGRAARGYLADRGVGDVAVGRFRLGYAPSEGRSLWRYLSAAGFEVSQLEKSGLFVQDAARERLLDRFRRRIIFPITNESGKVVALGGRALGEDQPKYLNSPETPIYVKGRVLYHLDQAAAAIRKQDAVVLVEGYMDAIAVASAGVDHVVASCGTSLTEAQVRLLSRFTRRVTVNYDPDSAGRAATERSLDLLLEGGFDVKVLALEAGQDPDEFIRQRGAPEYRKVLAEAPDYLDYLTERAIERHGIATPQGKTNAVNAVLPYLARIPNPLLRRELAARLAARVSVEDRILQDQLKHAASQGKKELGASSKAGAALLEAKLLRGFLENPAVLDGQVQDFETEQAFEGLAAREVFEKIAEVHRQEGKVDVHRLREMLTEQGQRLLEESLLASGDSPSEKELVAYCQALTRGRIEKEIRRLGAAIEQATRANDQARIAQLMRAKALWDSKLPKLQRGRENAHKKSNEPM